MDRTDGLRVRFPSILLKQLKRDEGFRAKVYADSIGKATIGYGRNLTDKGLEEWEAEYPLHNDIAEAIEHALRIFNDFDDWPPAAQHVVIGMLVNLGPDHFRSFKHTIGYLKAHCWVSAASELLDSNAARMLPERYQRYAEKLRELAK